MNAYVKVLSPIILVAFAGCAFLPSVGPSYEEPKTKDVAFALPDAGSTETNADKRVEISRDRLARWWTRFNDPILVDLVEGAVTNNRAYRMAEKRLEAANYELLGSYAAFLPKFGVGGAWNRNWYHDHVPSGGFARQHFNLQHAAVDGDWEIDIFGGSRRATEAALARAQEQGWTVSDAWISLTTQIGAEYVNLRTTQERIAVARANLALQTETYEILKSRLDSGIGDELAVNQCAYVVEQTRSRIPQLLAQEESIKNALAILTGNIPGSLDDFLRPLPEKRDWLLAPAKVSELPLNYLRSRPDVKAAERSLAAATAEIGVAKALWFPKFFINGSVGLESRDSVNLFSKDSFFATIGPSFSWPIFQGGAIYARVKAAEAKVEAAALNYENLLESAYADVRNAYSAYTQEYHRYRALDTAVKAASDAVTISQDLYKNGLRDFNNVLDAQRSRLQLEEEFVISRGQITINLIALYRALGGGLAIAE